MAAGYGDRSAGQRMWLAGALALLAVLAVGGGWLAWQGVRTAAPTLADATGPDPGRQLPAADGPVAFGAPEVRNGVPWGFPLTGEGALAAAVSAVAATGQPNVVFDPARFAEVAAVVFTDEQAVTQARQVDAARTEFEISGWAAQPPSRRLYFFAPLAATLTGWQPDASAATVDVWAVTLVGVGDAGGAVFTTSTVTLAGDRDTWTVTGLDTVQGPTPLVQSVASAPGRLRAQLRDAVATWPLPLPIGSTS